MWLFVAAPMFAVAAVAAAAAGGEVGPTVLVIAGTGLAVALVGHFSVLTIRIHGDRAVAAFGRGWPRKTVEFGRVTAVRVVRNRWLYGFGIRWIPHGSLWNVWGLDAVEFELASGRVVRFGTDEPAAVIAALSGRVPAG